MLFILRPPRSSLPFLQLRGSSGREKRGGGESKAGLSEEGGSRSEKMEDVVRSEIGRKGVLRSKREIRSSSKGRKSESTAFQVETDESSRGER